MGQWSASGAALVSGCVLPARPPRVNHVCSRIRASRSLQFHRNRGRTHLRCSDAGHLSVCAHARGHLTVARAEGSTIFVMFFCWGWWFEPQCSCLFVLQGSSRLFTLMFAAAALVFLLLMFN
jgi:hypothetical protein